MTQDFTVFNITKDAIVIRQALVDEAPWPTMSQESTEAPIEESTIEPLPEWLVESEVPVEGINTEVQKQ